MQCKDLPWAQSDNAPAVFMASASEADMEQAMKDIDELAKRLGRLHAPTRRRLEALSLAIYDGVGANCDDPLWIEFGRTMSPYNPQGNYK